jgi:dUTP pyrophosphatase
VRLDGYIHRTLPDTVGLFSWISILAQVLCHNKLMKICIKRFDKTLALPATKPHAAGIDLACRQDITIAPHEVKLVPVNIAVEVPDGYFLLLASRSSTPLKKGLMMANSIGIVDPFYNGDKDEVLVQLLNFTDQPVEIEKGELLTQALLMKHEPIEWNEVETFGADGYGGYKYKHLAS